MDHESSYDPNYEPVPVTDVSFVRRFLSRLAVKLYAAARWCEHRSLGDLFLPVQPPEFDSINEALFPKGDPREQLELALKNSTIREAVITGATRPRRTPEEQRAIMREHGNPGAGEYAWMEWQGPNSNTGNKNNDTVMGSGYSDDEEGD